MSMENTGKKVAEMSLKEEIIMTIRNKVKSEWKIFLAFNILGLVAWKLG
jgi:hypothetical protein